MSRSRGFLNIPDGKSLGKHIGVMAIDLLENHLLAAINAELPIIIDKIDEKLYGNLIYISVLQLYNLSLIKTKKCDMIKTVDNFHRYFFSLSKYVLRYRDEMIADRWDMRDVNESRSVVWIIYLQE